MSRFAFWSQTPEPLQAARVHSLKSVSAQGHPYGCPSQNGTKSPALTDVEPYNHPMSESPATTVPIVGCWPAAKPRQAIGERMLDIAICCVVISILPFFDVSIV
jgi:hypothetical protein